MKKIVLDVEEQDILIRMSSKDLDQVQVIAHKKASLIRLWYPVSFISMFPDILLKKKEGLTISCAGSGKNTRR